MKNEQKLRKKVKEKSEELEALKYEYLKLVFIKAKSEGSAKEIARLKDLLRSRNGKIANLKGQVNLLKSELKSKYTQLPFLEDTKSALLEAEKEVVDSSTNFLKDIVEDATNFSEIPEWNASLSYASGTAVMLADE